MSYEYPTEIGVIHLLRLQRQWTVKLNGRQGERWGSSNAAVHAVVQHKSGLSEWDQSDLSEVPDDLLDWRPRGESL